jgi:hypothetical protein
MAASARLSAAHKAESIGILHLAVRLGTWRSLGPIRLRPVLQQTRQNAKDDSTAQEASLSILAGTLEDRKPSTQLFMPHLLAERSPMGNLTFLTPYDPKAVSEVSKLLLCDVNHRDDTTDARFDGGDQSKDGGKASPRG